MLYTRLKIGAEREKLDQRRCRLQFRLDSSDINGHRMGPHQPTSHCSCHTEQAKSRTIVQL